MVGAAWTQLNQLNLHTGFSLTGYDMVRMPDTSVVVHRCLSVDRQLTDRTFVRTTRMAERGAGLLA